MLIKLTEISQTLLGSEDDIIVLDHRMNLKISAGSIRGVFDLTLKAGLSQ